VRDIVRLILIVPVFLGLVGCAGTPETPEDRDGVDPLFRVATVDEAARAQRTPDVPTSARGAQAFGIETQLVGADGNVLNAPRLTVYARQRANVCVIDQTAYIETFEVEVSGPDFIADPVVGVLQNGVVLELCVEARGDDAVLSYRVQVSDLERPIPQRTLAISQGPPVTIQLPKTTSSEVAGVRDVVPGVWTRLATLGRDHGAVDLHVRVAPAEIVVPDFEDRASETFLGEDAVVDDFVAPGGAELDLQEWLAAGGGDLRVDVDAVVLPGAAPVAEVLEAAAAERYGLTDARSLRGMSLTSRPVVGATMRVSLDEAYVADYDHEWDAPVVEPQVRTLRSGIAATFVGERELEVSWTTAPTWEVFTTQLVSDGFPVTLDLPEVRSHTLRIPVEPGSRVVTLGRTREGGTLAMRVTVGPTQRRVASQTQATRKRRPPVSVAR
jgi:hypothetical protein